MRTDSRPSRRTNNSPFMPSLPHPVDRSRHPETRLLDSPCLTAADQGKNEGRRVFFLGIIPPIPVEYNSQPEHILFNTKLGRDGTEPSVLYSTLHSRLWDQL
jgi:hypothetical protein